MKKHKLALKNIIYLSLSAVMLFASCSKSGTDKVQEEINTEDANKTFLRESIALLSSFSEADSSVALSVKKIEGKYVSFFYSRKAIDIDAAENNLTKAQAYVKKGETKVVSTAAQVGAEGVECMDDGGMFVSYKTPSGNYHVGCMGD